MHRVVALALPEVVAFDLAIAAEIFGHPDERDRYSFLVAAGHPGMVPSTSGFGIQATADLNALRMADTVIVPGFMPYEDPGPEVTAALRAAAAREARIASISLGAFALGAAGLLDGRGATTHWQHFDEFSRRFPKVAVNPGALLVDEGAVLTSGGAAAGIDLCLHLVTGDHGAPVATQISRRMVAPLQRSGGQARFMRRPLPGGLRNLGSTCDWAIGELHRPITVAELAAQAQVNTRVLTKRFQEETGMTPMEWLTTQRVLEAKRLLEATELPVEEIAQRCGLGSAGNLRLHLGRETAMTPAQYRRAFRSAAGMS